MRLSLFLLLVVATFAISFINHASAKEAVQVDNKEVAEFIAKLGSIDSTARHLKGDDEEENTEEERAINFRAAFSRLNPFKKGVKVPAADIKATKAQAMWQKARAAGKLDNIDEKKLSKVTEGVAVEVKKKPWKWKAFKETLKVVYGATIAALIIVGVDAMLGS